MKILTSTSKLPDIQKRERTEFKEFILSGKRKYSSSPNKENIV
jgi:hypothetical protein